MKKIVHLPRSRRIPFVPFAYPLDILFGGFDEDEELEEFDEEHLIDLMSRAAAGDTDIEIGASPEIAKQINEYTGREIAHTIE